MTTLYLDIDDEITSAAARIRTVDDTRIAIVLPAGSRVATSRINFRLLAREAQARNRSLAIVTSEASARALAASAGLPVFGSVAEYEDAIASGRASGDEGPEDEYDAEDAGPPSGAGVAGGAAGAVGAAGAGGAATRAAGSAAASGAAHGGAARPPVPPTASRPATSTSRAEIVAARGGRGRRTGWIVFLGFLAVVLVVGGVAGYLLLPSATVVLTPRMEIAGPVNLTVRADPNVTAADPANGIVPAQRQPFPVQASRSVAATGKKVEETKATGSVHWTNCDPTASHSIDSGTTVKTAGGVAFTTDGPAFLPVAIITFPGGQPVITCQGADVTITATKAGTAGNVDAGTITVTPPTLNGNVIKVTNPSATSGGTHTETQLVAKSDVDGAVAALRKALDQALTAALNEAIASGTDATVFADTKSLADITYSEDPNSFVGQQISSFTLGASATGFATAVDEAAVKQLAADKLTAGIASDEQLVPGSVEVSVGPGRADGQAVVFPVTARATQVRRVDVETLRNQVKGLTAQAARQALAPYGDAQVQLTPDWAATIPTFDFRLDVRIESVTPSPSPSPSPPASQSPSSSGASPAPSSSASSGTSSPAPGAS